MSSLSCSIRCPDSCTGKPWNYTVDCVSNIKWLQKYSHVQMTKFFSLYVALRKHMVQCTAGGIIINMNFWVLGLTRKKKKGTSVLPVELFTLLIIHSVVLSVSCWPKLYTEMHRKPCFNDISRSTRWLKKGLLLAQWISWSISYWKHIDMWVWGESW